MKFTKKSNLMNKKNKDNKKKNSKKFLILILSIFFCCFLIALGIILKFKNNRFTIKESRKEIGVCSNMKGTKNSTKYDIDFPCFDIAEIDDMIEETLQNEISSYALQNEKKDVKNAKIEGDYNSFSFNEDKGISIEFRFLKKSKEEKKQTVKNLVFCYGKKIEARHLFKKEKIKNVISSIKKEIRSDAKLLQNIKKEKVDLDSKLKNELSTLKNFIVRENSIDFSFDAGEILPEKYGVITTSIENSALKESFSKIYYKINPKEDPNKIDKQDRRKPVVALTFDDGPKEETTSKILDVLEKYNAHATFFVMGQEAKKFPEILQRQIANGHEIGNHTYSHKSLTKLSKKAMFSEIRRTNSIIEDATGQSVKLVRTPYGAVNQNVEDTLKYPFIHWSVDTKDWQTKSVSKTIDAVLKNAADGDIILMHDIYPWTAKAVETIVPELIDRGFSLVTVSEMFDLKNLSLEKGTQYHKAIAED